MFEVLPCVSLNPPSTLLIHLYPYQRNDDLAIRVCLEVVLLLEALAEDTVVVDFAVDGQRDGSLFVDERLSTGVYPE
jgi:hypothetical protein